ncbi:hypothetical protein [Streptomyces pseudovenezuelae]|uniref:hypothetical protein n=1 Tax=Streptomyces pseudovenezuelae TaxID=67350 RepID=UPI002E8231C3|nr:hypothetical protein [Streptomyces pseudovenezuelae]WUA94471.1 hypothetical protein OHO81_44660 [Streptomyces pseudovenezuelae]
MTEREFTPQEAALFDLLTEIVGLSDDTENAGRIMVLGPDGKFIGDASLSARDIQIAAKALAAARAFTEATKDIEVPAETVLDPVLEQDFEEHCIGLDPEFLMDLASEDPNSAVAAFDEITSQWDGGEL